MFTLLKKKLRSSAAVSAVIFAGLPVFMASTTVNAATLTFETIALIGDPVLGAPGGTLLSTFLDPTLNNQGETAFAGFVSNTGGGGIISNVGGTSSLVTALGDVAPIAGGGVFVGFSFEPTLDNQGDSAFLSISLTGTGVDGTNSAAIFSDVGGTLSLVARAGDAAPVVGAAVSFGFPGNPNLNGQGDIAFASVLTGTGVDGTNDTAIFSDVGGALSLVVREGDAVPDAGTGVSLGSLGSFFPPSLNDQGEIAFGALLTGTGVTNANNGSIFISDVGGALSLVAREGDAAPGAGDGVLFGELNDESPSLNDQGEIAFTAVLAGNDVTNANNSAIFGDVGGTLSLVAREGDAAPGAGEGVLFGSLREPTLNNQGDIAFGALLTGTGVTNANNSGIFLESDGMLSLLVREGDIIDLGDGDLATIISLSFGNNGFNDLGQIVFSANTSNGSGLFLASPDGIVVSPVPLPAALPLMASGLLGLVAIARRRKSAQA